MRDSFKVLVVVRDRHPQRSPALRSDATQGVPEVGRFSEQEWGDSDERHHPILAQTHPDAHPRVPTGNQVTVPGRPLK